MSQSRVFLTLQRLAKGENSDELALINRGPWPPECCGGGSGSEVCANPWVCGKGQCPIRSSMVWNKDEGHRLFPNYMNVNQPWGIFLGWEGVWTGKTFKMLHSRISEHKGVQCATWDFKAAWWAGFKLQILHIILDSFGPHLGLLPPASFLHMTHNHGFHFAYIRETRFSKTVKQKYTLVIVVMFKLVICLRRQITSRTLSGTGNTESCSLYFFFIVEKNTQLS